MADNAQLIYSNVIRSIINGLNNEELLLFKKLEIFFRNHIETLHGTAILFIKDDDLHFLARLYMMVTARIFIVVPTTMDKSSISTILSNNSQRSIVITDSIALLRSINPSFVSKEDPLINTLNISELYEEDINHLLLNNLEINGNSVLNSPAIGFNMYVYSTNKHLSRELIDQNLFALLYLNLKALLAMHDIHLERVNDNNCSLHAPVDDFFLYRALMCASETGDYNIAQPRSKVLLISYQKFKQIWDNLLDSTLQRRFLFNGYLHKFFGRFVIRYIIKKFKKKLSDYKKIVVLGLITDPTLGKVVNNLNGLKVFNTYGEANTLMATGMSERAGYISLLSGLSTTVVSLKETSGNSYQIMEDENSMITVNKNVSNIVLSFVSDQYLIQLSSSSLFRKEGQYAKYIGHVFSNGICPETIESIFNSFPFIRDTVLVRTSDGNYVIFIDTKEYLLDITRVNFNTWQGILKNQVKRINKVLNRRDLVLNGPHPLPSDLNNRTRMGLLDRSIFYEMEYIE